MSAASATTTIQVPLAVLRRVLDVHAEMRDLVLALQVVERRLREVHGSAWAATEAQKERLEGQREELEQEELDALRDYYVATAVALGIDPTRPADMVARLESTIRLAGGAR